MRLVSRTRQEVRLDPGVPELEPFAFTLDAGEAIVTEHSYKFDPAILEGLARSAGWRTSARWTDARDWFEVRYLER
jgi:uncharacterized SAM-dependent methyltransferase